MELRDDELELLLADTVEICAIPAPTLAEAERAEHVRARFEAAGVGATIDEVGNVVARVGAGGNPLVVAAHLDTVFGAATPIGAARDGNRLVGAGIGDNSLGLAALLLLARRLAGSEPGIPLALVATVGEEGEGDLRGARHVVAELEPRAFVALEGHGRDELITGGIGSVRYAVTYRTDGGHSWHDRGRPSAVHVLLERGDRLVRELGGRHVNIGTVEGGTSINTIAAQARCTIDCRDESDTRLAETAELLESVLTDVPDGVACELERIGQRPAGTTPADEPLLELARRARVDAGLEAAAEVASSTDANIAMSRGIPAVTVGLTVGHGAHTPGEWIEIPPLRAGAAAALGLVAAAIGVAG